MVSWSKKKSDRPGWGTWEGAIPLYLAQSRSRLHRVYRHSGLQNFVCKILRRLIKSPEHIGDVRERERERERGATRRACHRVKNDGAVFMSIVYGTHIMSGYTHIELPLGLI